MSCEDFLLMMRTIKGIFQNGKTTADKSPSFSIQSLVIVFLVCHPRVEAGSHKIDIDESFLSSPNALIGDLKLSSETPAFAGVTHAGLIRNET